MYAIKINGMYVKEINYNEDGSFKTVPMTHNKGDAKTFKKVGEAKKLSIALGGTVEEL